MTHQIIQFNVDNTIQAHGEENLYEARCSMVDILCQNDKAEATICVQAFNRLENTKACIESILQNTTDVEYKLLLVDSGSSDGTLEYFKSVPHDNTEILHFTKNINACYPQQFFMPYIEGRYYVQVNNDIIVTPRWLKNLITCAKSDIRIGMVNPVSSNVSNCQQVDLQFTNNDEMQQAADKYNQSNPLLWHEYMRLITLGTLYTRECLLAIGCLADPGFVHNFSDDDLSFRIRRSGYKLILARDTWVHHNHDFRAYEGEDEEKLINGCNAGMINFTKKYYGINSWADALQFDTALASMGRPSENPMQILGIDCECGTSLLSLKNALREKGCLDVNLNAFTQDAKYYIDLQTICDGTVVCNNEENITFLFPAASFDCILISRPLNLYHNPYKLLQSIAYLAKPGAQLLCKLTNTFGALALTNMMGNCDIYDNSCPLQIPAELLMQWFSEHGFDKGEIKPSLTYDDTKEMALAQKSQEVIKILTNSDSAVLRVGVKDFYISMFLKQ